VQGMQERVQEVQLSGVVEKAKPQRVHRAF
jgi:hypothetical protein